MTSAYSSVLYLNSHRRTQTHTNLLAEGPSNRVTGRKALVCVRPCGARRGEALGEDGSVANFKTWADPRI